MNPDSLIAKTATELGRDLESGACKAEEIAAAYLERIDQVDGKVHAFLHRDDENFLAQARASDERRAKGETLGPLDGVPVCLKDIISVEGQPLTAASFATRSCLCSWARLASS